MSTIPSSGSAYSPITSAEVKTHGTMRPATLSDEGALKLVVQDMARAEMWLGQKQWPLYWNETDILYQSPRSSVPFEGSTVTRANVSRFTVAKHVNSLVPGIMGGIFYDSPPFVLRPRPGTTQESARAWSALIDAMLEEIGFKNECERGIESQVLNGTGLWKYGWTTTTVIEKKFIRKAAPAKVDLPLGGSREVATTESDEFDVKEVQVTKNRPFFEHKPLGTVFIDPGWRHANDPNKAKYIIERAYPTFNDLNKLRQMKGYNIPPEDQLREFFFGAKEVALAPGGVEQQQQQLNGGAIHHAEGRDQITTEDPLEQPLELLERWDGERVMTVLQGKLCIRNEEHKLGRKPYLSANWWNIQNAGYGMGIGRLVGADQRVEQGSMNAALDILSFSVNPSYVRSESANVPTQQIRQRLGGILTVQGKVGEALALLEQPKVPAEVWTAIQMSKASSESTSGSDEAFSQGSLPGRGGSSVGRTATGAGGVIAAQASRIQGPVGRFTDNVFTPFLAVMADLIKERMPLNEIRDILDDELTEDIKVDFANFLNARLRFEILAGAHLAAKKAMAQSLPLMIQIFENPHMLQSLNSTGWTVDLKELFEMFMEMSEWKNNRQVIRKLTPEEMQTMAAMNPAVQKAQADKEQQDSDHKNRMEENDQKIEGRLASKLTEKAVDKASEPLLDAGERAVGRLSRVAMENSMSPQVLGTKDAEFYSTNQ